MRYRGRSFSEEEIEIIKQIIIEAPPPKYRKPISREICRRINWRQPSGGLKDMACRVALLQMEKDGVVQLPPVAESNLNRITQNQVNYKTENLPLLEPVCGLIKELALEIELVGKNESKLWNTYIDRYHYLGYTKLGGAQLRYTVKSKGRLVAFFGFSAAAWKVKARDEFIGWSPEQKEKNLNRVVNNSRFLILPSVQVPHLASHLLARIAKQLPHDWNRVYHYKPVLFETFVQKDKFKGTCYRAANWIHLGDTKGRGKFDRTHQNSAPLKSIWVYPLMKNFGKYLEK